MPISGVFSITPSRHRDDRGFLSETYNSRSLAELGIDVVFQQQNHIFTERTGTIRGLHFQAPPGATAKLIRVLKGSIFDVVVDLRRGSPSYGSHVAEVLSAENWAQLFHPVGFAHGFCTMEPGTEVAYLSSVPWRPELDRGLLWSDPDLGIEWPVSDDDAIVSDKDRSQPRLGDLETFFDADS